MNEDLLKGLAIRSEVWTTVDCRGGSEGNGEDIDGLVLGLGVGDGEGIGEGGSISELKYWFSGVRNSTLRVWKCCRRS